MMQAGQQSHLGLSTVRCDHHCCKGERGDMGRGKDENKNANTNSNIHIKVHKYKVRKDYKKQEEEWDPEVLALRKEAAMKLDLRDRLERSPRRRVSLKDMIPTAGHLLS